MCFSCFASENGVMLPAPPDSLQTWRPRAIDYRAMCDSLNWVGGMLNRYDIRRNIDLIRSLYPQVENIALVTDNTYGGISLQALVRAEWENYPDLNLVLVDSREGEETAFRTYATLPPRSAVMLGTWRVGSDGEFFMQRSLNDLVQNNPRVPVFSVTGTGIGDTAIGGYVPEYENGAEVIANQIRKYYDTDDIEDAHFHTSKSLYLFDSRKLKEWKIAEYALPKGSVIEDTMAAKLSKYSHYIELLVAGILLLVLLRPVLGADLEHLELDFDHYQAAVEERQEELADTQTEAMASIIAEQTEAYILDKAGELGLEVTVRVETRTEGNGIPVPWSAELTGSWSQALASALETELGIPAERQVWHEREAEN